MKIKNIIFDLGGVIFNIDYQKTSEAFKKLGATNFDQFYSQSQQHKLFDDFETGKISASEFRSGLRKALDLVATDDEIDAAWNAMLLDLPIKRLEFIKSLRKDYKVFLYSNINEIHFNKLFNICKNQHGISSFAGYFDREYYSHRFGKKKPHSTSFQAILDENDLCAQETLFIDDSRQHIEGARKTRMHAVHLTKDMSIFDTKKFINTAECIYTVNSEMKSEKIRSRL